MEEPKYIIVIGASAGGLQSITELMAQLTQEMNAAIFLVLHTPNTAYGDLIMQKLQKNTVFTCKLAEHGEKIQARHLYIAVPDNHLLLKQGTMILGRGPNENRWRPSIDVLFRSAAVAYGSRVIGIILTGLLEDGTTGMIAIKKSGGTCIVQDPKEAEYADMPLSVLNNVQVDYCVPLSEMGNILAEKTKNGVPLEQRVPEDVKTEASIAERV